ncbi:SLOG family protein [Xanthocytophaga agilis]|uniref:SLOG family protein n=1 Tax=Xanthocytophaga agilis TaxID=3048010 RepID=A0AAE3UHJ2_9BACT|nr:SLOG family protein [Xanthocytophaga agilis]MDJ1503537.1 SLOG family protein [Xanthocytophaga agilis]
MKLAITGSRSIQDCAQLLEELERLSITELIHGGAAGVDRLAAAWAISKAIKVTEIKPDYR